MKEDEILTRTELVQYCHKFGSTIIVREQKGDGTWDAIPFAVLPKYKQLEYIDDWHRRNHIPVRKVR